MSSQDEAGESRQAEAGKADNLPTFLKIRKGYWPELDPGYLDSQKKRLVWRGQRLRNAWCV